MIVVAHRGALHEALENSYSAFEKAIDAKAQRIELDVQLAADGSVWIMHDQQLYRTCGVAAKISDLNADQLAKLRLRNNEAIPELKEVLQRYLDRVEFNIEIKGSDPRLAEAVLQIIRPYQQDHKFVISSFRKEPLLWIRQEHPQLRVACLIGDMPPWPHIADQHPLIFMQTIGAKIIHPFAPLVDDNFMDQAKARGWKVIPYTSVVGEEDEDREGLWSRLMTLGVDGLCTNYPREMLAWLKEIDSYASTLENAE